MSGDSDFLLALLALGLGVGAAVLVYMVVVYARLKGDEERALREAKETLDEAAARERTPIYFKRYWPD
jgi:hypothetical protein